MCASEVELGSPMALVRFADEWTACRLLLMLRSVVHFKQEGLDDVVRELDAIKGELGVVTIFFCMLNMNKVIGFLYFSRT